MSRWPGLIVPVGHVEPVPRRIRGALREDIVVDSRRAAYVWDTPKYPRYAFPVEDVSLAALDGIELRRETLEGFGETVSIAWDALDAWFEEEEQVYVHPRSPYTRVDALRTNRHVRVERDGLLLAASSCPVVVFETGLPSRTYVDRRAVQWEHLQRSDTVTSCPYKGTTSQYWSLLLGDRVVPDIAWSYAFPTTALAAIAGLVCFYDERVDVTVDGVAQERPKTSF